MERTVVSFAVYEPPEPALPYVAVMNLKGNVTARAFPTAVEAEAYNRQMAVRMKARLGLDA